MSFNYPGFLRFAKQLRIETKEEGLRPLFPLLGTQEFLLSEIQKGLAEDIHHFCILKGRQDGCTTGLLALDQYWLFTHAALHGMMISDNEQNRDQFRATLTGYYDSLPRRMKVQSVTHNRNQWLLGNRSRLMYRIAGTTRKGTGFRGAGIALVHATEVSSYGDEEGLQELAASLAKTNPNRFYVFESTARGKNLFYSMCEDAKRAVTQRFIFLGWWLNARNSVPKTSIQYKTYWDARLSKEEREWIIEVKKLYNYEIQPEQIAWWRWQFYENYHEDTMMMVQEHPPSEHMAWVLTGSQWFNGKVLTTLYKWAEREKFEPYTYHFGEQFGDTILWPSTPRKADLKVWEKPVEGATYVIGGDPAYGGSVNADNFCCVVSRCYADGLDDVAEYASADISTYQFAWVICHLAGYYSQHGAQVLLNVEANGPGKAVMDEIRNLRRQAYTTPGERGKDIRDAVKHMAWWLFRRPDSLGATTNYIGTFISMNPEMKHHCMNKLRDVVHRGLYRIRSQDAILEMRDIIKEPPPDNDIHAEGRGKDDRVMARGLVAICWDATARPRLELSRHTRSAAAKAAEGKPTYSPIESAVANYFKAREFQEKLKTMRPRPGARMPI